MKLSLWGLDFHSPLSFQNEKPKYLRLIGLVICVISLLILRIIQYKIKELPDFEKDNDKYWQEGMSANRIINSLNKWTIDKMNDEYFRFNNINDKDLSIILKAFNINIPAKLYKPAELRKLKVSIKL